MSVTRLEGAEPWARPLLDEHGCQEECCRQAEDDAAHTYVAIFWTTVGVTGLLLVSGSLAWVGWHLRAWIAVIQ